MIARPAAKCITKSINGLSRLLGGYTTGLSTQPLRRVDQLHTMGMLLLRRGLKALRIRHRPRATQ
ncbi:hypothetical protein, partial [Mycobacterium parascrofulaceum]|uniref:hypothetical protein n=1 Tax=Mycobacterium parascrofulaceum TaxID=240125 RepID=UPI001AD827E1